MHMLDLSKIPAADHERHIVAVCQRFVDETEGARPYKVEDVLSVGEHLAESILAHYGSLRQASEKMLSATGSAPSPYKLPLSVLIVFAWAAMREHPTLGIMLDELYELYGEKATVSERGVLQNHREDLKLMKVARPSLINADGLIAYSPAAFAQIHAMSFSHQLSSVVLGGVPAIERLLSQYPELSKADQNILDAELAKNVCRNLVPDDDPIRLVLQGRIDEVEDAVARINAMFRCSLSNVPGSEFLKRRDHAFSLLDRMPRDKAAQAFQELDKVIRQWLDGKEELEEHYQPVQCLVDVLKRSLALGYDGMATITQHFDFVVEQYETPTREFIMRVIDDIEPLSLQDNTTLVWLRAGLISIEDEALMEMGLDEQHLAWFAHAKGSARLRQHLQKSSSGRDIIFGQDLGL